MTDRTRVLTVYLDDEFRTDDVQTIVSAIRALRGVERVDHVVYTPSDQMAVGFAKADLRREILQKMIEILRT